MANDNNRGFQVTNLDGSGARIIEAHGFEVEPNTGAVIFYDVDDKLVARLFNVHVEPVTATRTSSFELVQLAQKYIDFDLLDWLSGPQSPETTNEVSKDINSLAGSVLSQANPNA